MHGCTFNRKQNDIKGHALFFGLPGVFGALSFCLLALTVAADCRRTLRNTGIIMTLRPGQTAKSVALAGAVCALFSPGAVHAQTGTLTVFSPAPTVSAGTSLFNYFYVVNYTSPDAGLTDLAYVEFQAAPNAQLTNLAASPGFFTTYDPGNGFVTFLEDNDPATPQTFAANSPVSFSFSSPFGPTAVPYDGTDGVTNYNGTLLAPGLAAAPEPGTWATLAAGVFGLGLLGIRARRRASVSAS